jgi:hypothetical protein
MQNSFPSGIGQHDETLVACLSHIDATRAYRQQSQDLRARIHRGEIGMTSVLAIRELSDGLQPHG